MPKFKVIDADGHVHEPDDMWIKYLEPRYHPMAPRSVKDSRGRKTRLVGGHLQPFIPTPTKPKIGEARPGGHDPLARLPDMDLEGMEIAVLYPTTALGLFAIDRLDASVAMCRAYNNWLHDYCQKAPDRLKGIAVIPQMDIYETVVEARRAVAELGFKGVSFRPNPVGGRTLDNPAFDPVWDVLEELDAPAVIHAMGSSPRDMRPGVSGDQEDRDLFGNHMYRHVINHAHEQQLAMLMMICGGVLERHPKLRVGFLEAGAGWVPYWVDRMDEHSAYRGYASGPLRLKPSEYFARQCFVSAQSDERILPGVVQVLGDDNFTFASDYPHTDATFPGAVSALTDRKDLTAKTLSKILWDNPRRLYGLK